MTRRRVPGRAARAEQGQAWLRFVAAIALLAAIASLVVPRLRTLEAESRREETVALAASVESLVEAVHGIWLAAGRPGSIPWNGRRIVLRHGYPTAESLPEALRVASYFEYRRSVWLHVEAPDPSRCAVVYRPATEDRAADATALTAGC